MDLVLFFTRPLSLKAWRDAGILEREVALYSRLQERGVRVTFVTYGDKSELVYQQRLKGIQVLCNRWNLPVRVYAALLPFLHRRYFHRADIYKTNQTSGAGVALWASQVWRKPLIARCGYMWSDLAARSGREKEAHRARRIEADVFPRADRVVVTAPAMKTYVVENYGLPRSAINVIPNYVLTDLFSPKGRKPLSDRICFVGRLDEEKNPLALVEACAGLDVEIVMVGEGPLHYALENRAEELGVRLKLIGMVPHHELPAILRSATLFVLTSPREGHPKALLEAMACGLPVIGVDSPGIRELIEHRKTGILCASSPDEIRFAIQDAITDDELQEQIGPNARQYICENFSLDKIVDMELALLEEILQADKQSKLS